MPVEDNAWRVLAQFEGGDITLNDGGSGSIMIDGERAWGVSSGDDNTQIAVGENGATGETMVYRTGDTSTTALLEADVAC